MMSTYLEIYGVIPYGVMAKVLDFSLKVSEFKLQ